MSRHDRYLFGLVLARWGFAAMVAVAIATGLVVAMTVAPPPELPAVAIGASLVFRVEVGAAVFLALYIATMVFVLALHNRAFTEIGSGGVRARDVAAITEDAVAKEVSTELLTDLIDEIDDLRIARKGIELVTERRPATEEEIRARHERMHRLLEELRASVERKKAIVERWRAEGRLPPEEPRRRF